MKDGPAITAPVPYFGGKRTLAPLIAEELGKHSAYWEPFCGSMAVLFAKPPSAHETVNDLYGDLINLAMVLASPRWRELYERLQRTICCEAIFRQAKAAIAEEPSSLPVTCDAVDDANVARAYYYFLIAWVGRNGVAGTRRVNYQIAVRWTPGGGHGGTRVESAVESIPWFHRRLRRVLILCRDAFGVLAKIEDVEGVALYVDPPYLMHTRGSGRTSKRGGGGSNYLHDFEAEDHARLAEALRRFEKARVVVSYYDDPQLAELYPGWTMRRIKATKNLHVQNRRGAKRADAPEVLLINGRSFAPEFGEAEPRLF